MLSNGTLLQQLRKKVEKFRYPFNKAFGVVERCEVNVGSFHILCANGIPFNVIKSPQNRIVTKALIMIPKITNTCQLIYPETSLLDYKNIERRCAPFIETWLTQGNSVVSSHG